MEHLKKSFERDLKTKLSLKASGHIDENLLLLKQFKYYDTNNSGKCDKDIFAQALSKLGFYGYTDTDLDKIFLQYSNNKPLLDYNEFIAILYNKKEEVKENKEEEANKEKEV